MRQRVERCLAVILALALPLSISCHREAAKRPIASTPEGPSRGGQVIVATLADVTTFNDLQSAGDVFEQEVMSMLYPTLMIEQPDYQSHPPSFAPSLASSWEFSQDNHTLTFHLRPDARWSDGVPITGDDVRFTFQLQKDRRIDWLGFEIKDYITDVEVVDPHTVKFHFSRVYPYQLMDANDGYIVPSHAWGKVPIEKWRTTDFEPMLVTGGPFRVANHRRGQTLTLERDPGYWGSPRPYLDRIVFRVIPDVAGQVNQLLAGEVNLVETVPPRDADRIRRQPDLELVQFPSRSWMFVGWNNRDPLFSDRRVRRALTLAINRQAIVDSVYHGFAKLSVGPIISSMWAFNRNLQPLPYDPDQSRALLAEVGWRGADRGGLLERNGTPFTFDLIYPAGNTIREDAAVLIQADLARVGVRCRPTPVEFASFVARQESGHYQAAMAGWAEATKIDLTSAWSTPGPTQGSNNFVGYSNPEVDRLIAGAREESDYTQAKVLLDHIQEIIVADQPVTFLYEPKQLVGVSRHIRGADINSESVYFNVDEWYWGQ